MLIACAVVVRNLRVLDSFEARQREEERRRASGLGPAVRRRTPVTDLVATATANAPP